MTLPTPPELFRGQVNHLHAFLLTARQQLGAQLLRAPTIRVEVSWSVSTQPPADFGATMGVIALPTLLGVNVPYTAIHGKLPPKHTPHHPGDG